MLKTKGNIRNIFKNFNDEKIRKSFFIYFISFIGLLFLLLFNILEIINKEPTNSIISLLFFISVLLNIVFFRISKKIKATSHILVILMLAIELVLFINIENSQYVIFLFYLFPLFTILLFGNIIGNIYSVILILISSLIILFPVNFIKNNELKHVSLKFVLTYIMILIMINIFEYIQNNTQKALKKSKDDKEKLLSKISEKEKEINALQIKLENKQYIIRNQNRELDSQNKITKEFIENNIKLEELQQNQKIYARILQTSNEEAKALNNELKQQNEEIQTINNQLKEKSDIIEKQNNDLEQTLKILENQQERINEINKDIRDSVIYAKTIQDALLPSTEILEKYFSNYFLLYEPKQTVSGDFYFAYKTRNHIVFAVADCTGHGIPGGFITMLGSTFLYDIVKREDVFTTGEVLNKMRNRIKEIFSKSGNKNQNGLDIALCAINLETNIMQYSGAFSSIIIIRDEKTTEYKGVRNPIGFYPIEKDFETTYIKLENNDLIYLFSDGYADQIGIKINKKYSSKLFRETLFNLHGMPLKDQGQILDKTIRNWRGVLEQTDDITVLGIKWEINDNKQLPT